MIGCLIAPSLCDPRFTGIITYIEKFQGYISPGILAAFLFGIIFKELPPMTIVVALLACIPAFGFLQWQLDEIAFFYQNGNYIWYHTIIKGNHYNCKTNKGT